MGEIQATGANTWHERNACGLAVLGLRVVANDLAYWN